MNNENEKCAEKIEVPNGMDETKKDCIAWVEYRDKFKAWLVASRTAEGDEKMKCLYLLNLIGHKGMNIFNTLGLDVEKLNSLDDLMNRLDKAILIKGKKKNRRRRL